MVVRNSWSVVACVCLVGALGCGGKSDPAATVAPVVTSFTPAKGAVGSSVTITGTGFDGTTNVSVGGVTATFTRNSSTQITLSVPSGAMSGILGVVNAKGSGGSSTPFYVTPKVTSTSPTSGSPGTAVTLSGSGLSGTTKVVFGSGPAATFYVNSANQAQAIVPIGSTSGPITVTASNGDTATSPNFTYSGGGVTAPVLTSFSPAQALTGENVNLVGSGFTSVASVKIGGVNAYFSVSSDTAMSIQVPAAAASGTIQLLSYLGNASSATRFIVTPTLASFTPAQGHAGTLVTLTGTGFVGTTAVRFGNATTSNFIVTDANTIQANVAAGSASGPISLVSNGVTCSSAASFTFLADPTGAPVLTSFSPVQALTGQSVVLTGTGFTGATGVTVGGADAVFTVNSDTQITLTVPADAASGFIAVTNALGVSGSSTTFTLTPTITAISPRTGQVGTTVNITGTGFIGTTTISFGGGSPCNFAVIDANHATAQVAADSTTGAVKLVSSGVTCTSDESNTFTVLP